MKFGKTEDLSDLSFPPDHPQTAYLLEGLPASQTLKLYIGTPAWGCPNWVGNIYPPKTKPGDFLKYYAQQFSTIELNTTHYRTPDEATVLRWRDAVPSSFRFCPKIPQFISHSSNLATASAAPFCEAVRLMGEKLGPCFMQLPQHFGPDRAKELLFFLERFPKGIRLSLEFRHEGWFGGDARAEDVWAAMQAMEIGAVITDVAGRRDVLHQRLTTPWPLIRLVGNELHPSDFVRMDAWIQRLSEWHSKGLGEAYLFIHQPDEVLCPEMGDYIIAQANKQLPVAMRPLHRYGLGL